jgi:hypothetical protein
VFKAEQAARVRNADRIAVDRTRHEYESIARLSNNGLSDCVQLVDRCRNAVFP